MTCSETVQQRYEVEPEAKTQRLPILISLVAYAKQIERADCSLLTYMQQIAQNEFNLSQVTVEFFEQFTGQ